VGEIAPDFTLETLDGEEFTLSEAYANRPVVIEFGSYT
jgi:peroxiredoxin